MKTVLRTFAGVLAGLAFVLALVVAVEVFSNVVHPFPKDFDGTHDAICKHVERYPAWVLASVVPMWGLTGFLGVWAARRVGGRVASPVVGLPVFAALVFNLSMLPYPSWFKAANLVVMPAAMLLGGGFVPLRGATARVSPDVAPLGGPVAS